MGDGLLYVRLDVLDNLVASVLCVFCADFCSDGEARRYGHSEEIHLGKVSTLAAEKISHLGITFGLSVAERINLLCH